MTKKEYLDRLKKALGDVNREEKNKLLEYYRELIEDGIESGKSEEAVVAELELPEDVARTYRAETGRTDFKHSEAPPASSNQLGKVLMAILGVFVAFAGFWVLFGLFIAGISVFISGIAVFAAAFGLFVRSAAAAFAQMGAGLLVFGVGGLLLVLTALVGKWFAVLLCTLFSVKKKPFRLKGTAVFSAISGGCFVLGLFLFLAAFGSVGFVGSRLVTTGDLIQREQSLTLEEDSLSLISDDLELNIVTTDGEAKLVYSEFEDQPKQYSFENGTIRLQSREGTGFALWWNRGIFFTVFAREYDKGTLYLPAEFVGSLNAELENGAVKGNNLTLSNLTLKTENGAISVEGGSVEKLHIETKNGAVRVENCTVDTAYAESKNGAIKLARLEGKEISAYAKNGAILLEDCTGGTIHAETNNGATKLVRCQGERIDARTNNGAVDVEQISAQEIELFTSNGAVKGRIAGSRAEYRIDARADLGSCNLSNKTDGEKSLIVRTNCGSINVVFAS